MARKKLTPLEQQVWDLWDELSFRDGGFAGKPLTREETAERERERMPEWDAILSLAHDGEQWQVGLPIAATVSQSRWYRRMVLSEYAEAEAEMDRLLRHPDWEGASRSSKSEVSIQINLARIGQGDMVEACVALQDWVEHGPYSPGSMALSMVLGLSGLLEDLPEDWTMTPELISLVTTIATARRALKKVIRACAEIQTFDDAVCCLDAAMGWERPPESAV